MERLRRCRHRSNGCPASSRPRQGPSAADKAWQTALPCRRRRVACGGCSTTPQGRRRPGCLAPKASPVFSAWQCSLLCWTAQWRSAPGATPEQGRAFGGSSAGPQVVRLFALMGEPIVPAIRPFVEPSPRPGGSACGGRSTKAAQCAALKGVGPTRARTVDRRIMSCLETPQAQ